MYIYQFTILKTIRVKLVKTKLLMAACNEIIDDIEDLISSQDISPKERYSSRKNVTYRPKKTRTLETVEKTIHSSVIPGTQKIYVKTWGCAHNNSDSEYMAGQLAAYGYHIVPEPDDADLWLLNSCTVKNPAEDHFRNMIENGNKQGKHLVLAGCVPQGSSKSSYLSKLSVIGVQQIDRIVEVVEETLKGHTVRLLAKKKVDGKKIGGAALSLPKVRKNPLIEIIAINTGCLNQCTYCKTKHARGELGSYSIEEILERAEQAFKEGVVEIWLTSEDTGAYGKDIGTSLSQLLFKLVEVVPDGCKIRVGMTNPPYIKDQLEDIAKVLSHPACYKFLHIPVQSGSNNVLNDMKREYTREEFEEVVNYMRKNVPGITIATDIICGFPTETEADFDETMSLCEKYKFPSLFINQFYPRPGTPAARMTRIPADQVKNRTKRLTDLFLSYEPYGDKINEIQRVLVTEESSFDNNYSVGHNECYEQVLVPKNAEYLGKMITVRIVRVSKFSMIGELYTESATVIEKPGVAEPLKKGQLSGVIREKTPNNSTGNFRTIVIFFALLVALFSRVVYVNLDYWKEF